MKRPRRSACRIQNSHINQFETLDLLAGERSSSSSQSMQFARIQPCATSENSILDPCRPGSIIDSNAAASACASGHVCRSSKEEENFSHLSPQGLHIWWCKPWNKEMLDSTDPSLGWVVWPDIGIDSDAAASACVSEHVNARSQACDNSEQLRSSAKVVDSPPHHWAPCLRESRRKRRRMNSPPSWEPSISPASQQRSAPNVNMAFVGEYRGATWNARSLFARKATRQTPKMNFVQKLLSSHDFVGLQETHSTKGFVKTAQLPPGVTSFWGHDSQSTGGVGLLVNNKFLSKFDPITSDSWLILEEGRVGRLQLQGQHGNLHLYVIYMASGQDATAMRAATRDVLVSNMASPSSALSILMGDWNYATTATDRFTKATAEWSGASDETEHHDFQRMLADEFSLFELHQEGMTCNNGLARSRIDRVYTNHHVVEQLDRVHVASTLSWCPELSAHRPVSFSRRCPQPQCSAGSKPIPNAILKHP